MENIIDKRINVLNHFETLQRFLHDKYIGDIKIDMLEMINPDDPYMSGQFDNGYGVYADYFCKFMCNSYGIKIAHEGPLLETEYIVGIKELEKWFKSYQQFRIEIFERKIKEWKKKGEK